MQKLEHLCLNNINLDFAKCAVNIKIPNLKSLALVNGTKRVKMFDENELKQFKASFPNLEELAMDNNPIQDKECLYLLTNFN
jgi:hypothetical protein